MSTPRDECYTNEDYTTIGEKKSDGDIDSGQHYEPGFSMK